MDTNHDLVLIGLVRRARGNRGEVVVGAMTPDRDRFLSLGRVFVGRDGRDAAPRAVERAWLHCGRVILKLAGVDSISQAEAMAGLGIFVLNEERIVLPSWTFFQHDLIGLEVRDRTRGPLGRVTGVIETGGTDVLEVDIAGRQILVPAARQYCTAIETEKGFIEVDLPEELLTLDEN